jgi:hypothetical protein
MLECLGQAKQKIQIADSRGRFSGVLVHGTLGFVPLYLVRQGQLEIKIRESETGSIGATYARLAVGSFSQVEGGGSLFSIGGVWLTGAASKHLEMQAGLTFQILEGGSGFPIPSGSIGYRFQPPGSGHLFRIGAGYPEAVFLGFGFCF